MAIEGKKINELTQISDVSNETVLPAVYVNGSTTASTANKISVQQISTKVQGDLAPALAAKQDLLPEGTEGYFLKKTASGVEWAQAASGTTDVNTISATSGSISLETNKVYKVTLNGNTTFVLPNTVDNTKFNQIYLQINLTNNSNINFGTSNYFTVQPTLEIGENRITYEYDANEQVWYVGKIGEQSSGGDANKANTNLDNLTDSAQISVANLLDDLYNTVGCNIVGSDVTVTDGVASGFSSTSYLQGIKAPNTVNKVDITVKFKLTGATDGCLLFFRNLYFFAYPNGNILSAQYASDSSWKNLLIESGQTITNTDVWVHFVDTGTSQEMEYSLDGVNYVGKVTSAYTDDLTEDYALEIGSRWQGSNPFPGEIDLNETVILLDEKPWFVGKAEQVKPAHLAMPSDVYDTLTPSLVNSISPEYTAPSDGYYQAAIHYTGSSARVFIVVNLGTNGQLVDGDLSQSTYVCAIRNNSGEQGEDAIIIMPISKGQKLQVVTNADFTGLRFIYAEGAKSEAN